MTPIPSREACIQAAAQTSAQLQSARWERLRSEGPEDVAAGTHQAWMSSGEKELAGYYARRLEGRAVA